jgi:hypothetical protein
MNLFTIDELENIFKNYYKFSGESIALSDFFLPYVILYEMIRKASNTNCLI